MRMIAMKHCLLGGIILSSLAAGGCESVWSGTKNITRPFVEMASGKTAVNAALKMEDRTSADNRRYGINYLASHEYGLNETYLRRYRQIAQSDPDFSVRAAAIRA